MATRTGARPRPATQCTAMVPLDSSILVVVVVVVVVGVLAVEEAVAEFGGCAIAEVECDVE